LNKYKLSKTRTDAGFSLLECVIALAMLSIALGWLSNLFLQQRLNNLKNESTTGSVKVAQTMLDNLRQRNPLSIPTTGSQVCKKSTLFDITKLPYPSNLSHPDNITDADYLPILCPLVGASETEQLQELNNIFGEYYEATITLCPYDSGTDNSKKCNENSRYIKIEVVDTRRKGADAEKYTNEIFFTKFRQ
jgi:prepilin-type N-terminal cleavage/methylation domain-containing protein